MKLYIIFTLLFLGCIPVSCLNSCTGENFDYIKDFRIIRFDLVTTDMYGNDISETEYFSKDSVYKKLFVVEKKDVASNLPLNFSFSTPLYACSPPDPRSTSYISKFQIIAKNSFQDNGEIIPIETDITSKFLLSEGNGRIPNNIEEILKFKRLFYYDTAFFLKSNVKTSENQELIFDILITMSDGIRHEFKDEIFRIK